MREVAIIGAGELGGAAAHALARLDAARFIRIIDEHGRAAEGKALDIAQAAPLEGFATELAGATDIARAAGADLVVIADRFGSGEWSADEGFSLLRLIARLARGPVICAGAAAAALVERGVCELKIARERLFGTAPDALVQGARSLIALAVDGSARDVELAVVGLPPAHTIVVWAEATFAGRLLTSVLTEPARRRLDARIAALWPPGPMALAAAASKAVAGIDGRTRQRTCCFVAPDTSTGVRTRVAALPVRLAADGIAEITIPSLSVADQVALDNAMML